MCWYIFIFIGVWIVVSFLSYRNFLVNNSFFKEVSKKSKHVMFVVAHPDDECMFFGPAITALTKPSSSDSNSRKKAKNIYLLCLSDGKC